MLSAFTSELTALATVIVIDLVLAGDNAIVVGMAAAGLPPELRKRAILPRHRRRRGPPHFLRDLYYPASGDHRPDARRRNPVAVGRLETGARDHGAAPPAQTDQRQSGSRTCARSPRRPRIYAHALIQIVIADVSMSLDNVLAVAGAARQHIEVLVIGLALSVALMGAAATLIARILHRFFWISYLGWR